ncbi:MAG: long-chain acyl-CoA synthetase [Saprospiraceae bacterium]|jgi:long-chain acyl-CoA synthetase
MFTNSESLLSLVDKFYHWEEIQPDKIFLRQPKGDQWHTLTYAVAGQEARRMATALAAKGLKPGDHIGILSKNCYHWILADLAIMMGGYVSVPYYASLPQKQLKEVIELSDIKLLFVGKLDDWGDREQAVPNKVNVIRFPHYEDNALVNLGEDWNELLAIHEPKLENHKTDIDSLWTIKFTSGTTGKPKGVMLSHRSPAMMMAAEKKTNWIVLFKIPEIRCLSYLPLNHVGERIGMQLIVLTLGGTISFAENLGTFGQNLRDTKPTVFFAVPRIWTKFYLGVMAKIPAKKLDLMLANPDTTEKIKQQLRASLGFSELTVAITGAAITPAFIKDFYKKLDIHLIEAYGMTEVCGSITNSPTPDSPQDSVGKARPYAEIKIHPETEEILLKSPFIMMGYYKNAEKTAAVLIDGWMHSGDRGSIDEHGFLRIKGRVTDAFKTSKGSYVTPNPLEEILMVNDYIEQVCVVGLGIPQPLALVNLSEIGFFADRSNVEVSLRESIRQLNDQRAPFERISTVIIQEESWSEENRCLTPTLKVKRGALDDTFGTQYLDWHEMKDTVLWT